MAEHELRQNQLEMNIQPLFTASLGKRLAGFPIAAALAAGIVSPACAADEDVRIWENVTTTVKLGAIDPALDKWRLWLEGQGRFRDGASVGDQALARTGIGYQVTDHVSLWGGYAHVWTYPEGSATNHENRIWQQVTLTDTAWFGDWSSRTRLEQRFIDGVSTVEWRLRENVRFAAPIADTPLSLVIWNEVFLRLNSTTQSARFGFDQNRAFAGFAYKFGDPARVEIGYMNQLIQSRSASQSTQRFTERMNHVFSVSLFLNP